jgi:hypothetical protein
MGGVKNKGTQKTFQVDFRKHHRFFTQRGLANASTLLGTSKGSSIKFKLK